MAYFPVSTTKLIVMSIATFGLYEFYWSFRTWKSIRDDQGARLSPFWRAWFVLLFHYNLVKHVKDDLSTRAPVRYRPGWLTIAYLLLLATSSLPNPFWLVCYLTFLPLLPVVAAVNSANAGRIPEARMNRRFTVQNIAVIVVFGLVQLLVLTLAIRPNVLSG
ncbi:MAG: hypothetical protein ACYC6T_02150 [Thermoleophilia bacterium]